MQHKIIFYKIFQRGPLVGYPLLTEIPCDTAEAEGRLRQLREQEREQTVLRDRYSGAPYTITDLRCINIAENAR
jgi:hypothetical protein